MRNYNFGIAAASFLMCLLSVYFGISIFNANTNAPIQHLNEADNINYFDIRLVPMLSQKASIYTFPMIMAILIMEIMIIVKSKIKVVKNIALGMLSAIIIVFVFDVMIFLNPYDFDFSKWGFVWICLGIIIIAGNLLSAVMRANAPLKKAD